MTPSFDDTTCMIEWARRWALWLVATGAIQWQEWEDARQQLLMDFLRRSQRFDPARGNWPAFVYGIMAHHAAVLAAQMNRRRRREVLLEDLEAPDVEWAGFTDPTISVERIVDIRRVVGGLAPRLRDLALYLSHYSVTETCWRMRRSRSAVYKGISRLRRAFTAAGLAASSGHRTRP
jgi:hypothetical protein